MSEKKVRNSIANDLWVEEQRASEELRKLDIFSREYSHLAGVIRGLTRARDIVEKQGPPAHATLEERKQMVDEMLNEKD